MKHSKYFFIFFVLISKPLSIISSDNGYLDQLAIKYKTDKCSEYHGYSHIYEKYFSPIRHKKLNFLEIGLLFGHSAQMWEQYFPNATLHFIDIDKKFINAARNFLSKRSTCYLVNQANKDGLIKFANNIGEKFDIIIDDGGHTMQQQLTSFHTLFPFVKSGGIYIIEDLHTSYWKNLYGGGGSPTNPQAGPGTTIHFLKNLIDDVNFIGATNKKANFDLYPEDMIKKLSYYQKNILSMHFYGSLCFIFKR